MHTPSIAFRHLPPNSAKFSYATEGALFISAQLFTDAVSAFRKVWVLIKLQALVYDILLWRRVPESDARSVGTNMTVEATLRESTHVNMRRIHLVLKKKKKKEIEKKKSSVSIQTILVLFELA